MRGNQSVTSTAYPYPFAGGPGVNFEQDDIVALGKVSYRGDNRIHYIVRLRDGREVFVNASKQPDVDKKWLYKWGKRVRFGTCTSREVPVILVWGE